MRFILNFSLIKFLQILLITVALPRNRLDLWIYPKRTFAATLCKNVKKKETCHKIVLGRSDMFQVVGLNQVRRFSEKSFFISFPQKSFFLISLVFGRSDLFQVVGLFQARIISKKRFLLIFLVFSRSDMFQIIGLYQVRLFWQKSLFWFLSCLIEVICSK